MPVADLPIVTLPHAPKAGIVANHPVLQTNINNILRASLYNALMVQYEDGSDAGITTLMQGEVCANNMKIATKFANDAAPALAKQILEYVTNAMINVTIPYPGLSLLANVPGFASCPVAGVIPYTNIMVS